MQQRRSLVAALLGFSVGAAKAQATSSVVLAGRMDERALLMVNGQAHMLGLGQVAAGVRLLRWQDDAAVVELGGRSLLLRVGASPSHLGGAPAPAAEREIFIAAGPGGHFVTMGAINGRAVQFLVDTGATVVALSQGEGQRLGLDLKNARGGMAQTANGPVATQLVSLSSVRVGGVQVAHVDAMVLPSAMPHVLLGNSFLSRFQMRRDNDVLRLALR